MSAVETEAAAAELAVRKHAGIAPALVAALADVAVIDRGRTAKIEKKTGGSYSYSYADLSDVVAETRPILARHGLVALTPVSGRDGGLQVVVVLLHSTGEREVFDPLPFNASADPQAAGSLMTYYRRYALCAALGIATGVDDDGAAGAKAAARPAPPQPLTVNQAKNYLVKLLTDLLGDADVAKAEAVQAWSWEAFTEPDEWFPRDVESLAKAWNERPMDAPAPATPQRSVPPEDA